MKIEWIFSTRINTPLPQFFHNFSEFSSPNLYSPRIIYKTNFNFIKKIYHIFQHMLHKKSQSIFTEKNEIKMKVKIFLFPGYTTFFVRLWVTRKVMLKNVNLKKLCSCGWKIHFYIFMAWFIEGNFLKIKFVEWRQGILWKGILISLMIPHILKFFMQLDLQQYEAMKNIFWYIFRINLSLIFHIFFIFPRKRLPFFLLT